MLFQSFYIYPVFRRLRTGYSALHSGGLAEDRIEEKPSVIPLRLGETGAIQSPILYFMVLDVEYDSPTHRMPESKPQRHNVFTNV